MAKNDTFTGVNFVRAMRDRVTYIDNKPSRDGNWSGAIVIREWLTWGGQPLANVGRSDR